MTQDDMLDPPDPFDRLERVESALEKVLKLLRRPAAEVPLSDQLWGYAEIAEYLRCSAGNVQNNITCNPDFPRCVVVPTRTGRSRKRYYAGEVIEWVKKYRRTS